MTTFEALSQIAHRVAVSENERIDLTAAFLAAFGSDEEKKRFYTESAADKDARLAKEKFDLAVAAEVQKRADASAHDAAVKAAADAQAIQVPA